MVFTRNSNVHSYQTRQAHDPHFVARKSSFISKFCMYQAPVAWSNLPHATKSCKAVKSFNYQVKKYYIKVYCTILSHLVIGPYYLSMSYIPACHVPVQCDVERWSYICTFVYLYLCVVPPDRY